MRQLVLALLALLFLGGCGDSGSQKVEKQVLFDFEKHIPFPNDLFYLPTKQEAADGTINLPYEANSSAAPIIKEVNKLDGFSTTSPLVIETQALVDPTSLIGKIHIYEVNATRQGVLFLPTAVIAEYKDFDFVSKDNSIVIIPKKPFKGASHYIVAIDRGVYTLDGSDLVPSQELRYVMGEGSGDARLDALKPIYRQMLHVTGRTAKNTVAIWSFTTQTIGKVADALMHKEYNSTLALQSLGASTKELLAASGVDVSMMRGNDHLFAGLLKNVPYFLAKPTRTDPIAPVHRRMDLNSKETVDIPVLASIPKECPMPKSGYPVVIFQHGITQNRTNLLAVSETFASICYASVAIDLPLHGITDPSNPLYMQGYERTFDLDLLTQSGDVSVIGSDGVIDASGSFYINLANPAISKDNILQSTADIMALRHALGRVFSDKNIKFDTSKVYYVGHSLGAMVPYPYLSEHTFGASVLANPGGGIAQLLNNSPTFGPIISATLASYGLQKGSDAYSKYMLLTQTLIDDADPINYAAKLKKQPILAYEVKGDAVIPNHVLGAPLSGTDPLLAQMKATNILQASQPLAPGSYAARFLYGEHSSLIRATYPEVTMEMHKEMASFLASSGRAVRIGDATLLGQDGDF